MSVSPPSSVTKTSPCWKGLIDPGSTLMYGSSLRKVMSRPRFSRRAPMLAEASPFPRELTTPPVTKMNFVFLERMGNIHVPRTGRVVNEAGLTGGAGYQSEREASLELVERRQFPRVWFGLTTTLTTPSARRP